MQRAMIPNVLKERGIKIFLAKSGTRVMQYKEDS